jgi:hypothetical protein
MAKTLPNVPVHNGSKFSWCGPNGSAELSDFNPVTLASRLYGDACDVGFYVQGNRHRVLFHEVLVERREGEVVAYHYESEEGFRITVYND